MKKTKKRAALKKAAKETLITPATEVEETPEAPAVEAQEEVPAVEAAPAPKHRARKAKTETQENEQPKKKRILKKKENADVPASAEESIVLQYDGLELNIAELKERVISAYVEAGHRRGRISKLNLYIKPEDRKVYYVINDKVSDSIDF
jgi:hypothetical protein